MGGVYGPPVTMSYQSASLSTLEYRPNAPPATKTLDFADLPCPPSDVAEAYNSKAPYFPVLISPFGVEFNGIIYEYNGTNHTFNGLADIYRRLKFGPSQCQVAAVRDPPVHATRVPTITGPKDGDGSIP